MGRKATYYDQGTNVPKTTDWYFTFNTNAGADPLASTFQPPSGHWVKTITRTAAGEYTITLVDNLSFHAVIESDAIMSDLVTGDGRYATMGPITGAVGANSGNITFKVWTFTTGGVKTDFPANASTVFCKIKFKEGLAQG